MIDQIPVPRFRWRVLLLILAAVCLIAAYWLSHRSASNPRTLLVQVNRHGIATIWGLPLANTRLRDSAFRLISISKVRVNVGMPNWSPSDSDFKNMDETMIAINKAALLTSAPAVTTSPFE